MVIMFNLFPVLSSELLSSPLYSPGPLYTRCTLISHQHSTLVFHPRSPHLLSTLASSSLVCGELVWPSSPSISTHRSSYSIRLARALPVRFPYASLDKICLLLVLLLWLWFWYPCSGRLPVLSTFHPPLSASISVHLCSFHLSWKEPLHRSSKQTLEVNLILFIVSNSFPRKHFDENLSLESK